jgi:hypothetical protein
MLMNNVKNENSTKSHVVGQHALKMNSRQDELKNMHKRYSSIVS